MTEEQLNLFLKALFALLPEAEVVTEINPEVEFDFGSKTQQLKSLGRAGYNFAKANYGLQILDAAAQQH